MTLIDAAKSGNFQQALDLLRSEGCGSINERDAEMKGTAIFWAANGGHQEIVQLLLNFGADVEIPVKWGMTPLLAAVDRKHYQTTQILLLSGANVNAQSQKGDTALHIAAYRGSSQLCKLLMAYGVNMLTLNNNGKTAQQEAAGAGHMSLTKILVPESNHNQKSQVFRSSSLPLAYSKHQVANGAHLEDSRLPSENDETVPTSSNSRTSLRRRILKSAVSTSTAAGNEKDLTRSHSATQLNIQGRMSPPVPQESNQQSNSQQFNQRPLSPSGYQQPISPNGYQPSSPDACRPQSPSRHHFQSPSGYQPQSLGGYQPQSPRDNNQHASQRPGSPLGYQQGSPTGYHQQGSRRQGSPNAYQQGIPSGYQPGSHGNHPQGSFGGHCSQNHGVRRSSDPRPLSPFGFPQPGNPTGNLPGNASGSHGLRSPRSPHTGSTGGQLPENLIDFQRNPLVYHSENPLDYTRNGVDVYSRADSSPNVDVRFNLPQASKQQRDLKKESDRFFHDIKPTSSSHNQKMHKSQKQSSLKKDSLDSSNRELFPGIERLLSIIEKLETDKNNLTKENKVLTQKLQTLQTLVDSFMTDTSSEESWQAHQGSSGQQTVSFHQTLCGELESEKRRKADLEKLCEMLVTENCRLRTCMGSLQAMDISQVGIPMAEDTGLATETSNQRNKLSVLLKDNADLNQTSPDDIPLESPLSTSSSSTPSSVSSMSPNNSQSSECMSPPESSCQTQMPGDWPSSAKKTFAVECLHTLNTSYLRPRTHSGTISTTASRTGTGSSVADSKKSLNVVTEYSHASSNVCDVPERDSPQSSSRNFQVPMKGHPQLGSNNFPLVTGQGNSQPRFRTNFQSPVAGSTQSSSSQFQLPGTEGHSRSSSRTALHQQIKALLQSHGATSGSLLKGEWLETVELDSSCTLSLQEKIEQEVLGDKTILATFQSVVSAKPRILKVHYRVNKEKENTPAPFQVEDDLSPNPHLFLPIGRLEKTSGRPDDLQQLLLHHLHLDPAGAKQGEAQKVEVIDCRVYPAYMLTLQQLFDCTRELAPSLSLDQDLREETCLLRILLQLLRALDSLHQQGVVLPRDVNPGSTYIMDDMRVVIGGLHRARFLKEKDNHPSLLERDNRPEFSEKYSHPMSQPLSNKENHPSLHHGPDSYSVAAMLCSLLTGPDSVTKLPIAPPDWLSSNLRCLLTDMLSAEPENRVPVNIAMLRATMLLYGPLDGEVQTPGDCEQWLTSQAFRLLMNTPPDTNRPDSVLDSGSHAAITRLDWVMCRDFILAVTPEQLWKLYSACRTTP